MLIGPAAPEEGWDGSRDQLAIVEQRPARYVQIIKSDHFAERNVTSAENLPESGDSRFEGKPTTAPIPYIEILVEWKWPGANQAHSAAEDVDELRHLVDGAPS
jgi:hypothetical protein